MIRRAFLLAMASSLILAIFGCAEQTQQAAQDSQAAINKEMKERGDDKTAY